MTRDALKKMVEREHARYGGHTSPVPDVPGSMSATGVDDPVPDAEYGDEPGDIDTEHPEETRSDLDEMVEQEREEYGGHTSPVPDVPGSMSATGVDDPVPDAEYGDSPEDIDTEHR